MAVGSHNKFAMQVAKKSTLTLDTINQAYVEMRYAIKSKVYLRYTKHALDMKSGLKKPFNKLLPINLGDAQSFGQIPITYLRQILALCLCPWIQNDRTISFPDDVKIRAKRISRELYYNKIFHEPQGMKTVRKHIAKFIQERDDGFQSLPKNIFVQDTASNIDTLMRMVCKRTGDRPVGILAPIPVYPMYTAVVDKYKMKLIQYYLDEDTGWQLDIDDLRNTIRKARKTCCPKGMLIINPGNPTGQVLSHKNIEEIIQFCYNENLFLIADEVYQHNIYCPQVKFHSFKKVKHQMGPKFQGLELASLHSVSKGFLCECGLRGAYIELDGFHDAVTTAFLKQVELNKTTNMAGQIATDVLTRPPADNEPSSQLFQCEKSTILNTMADKAMRITSRLNAIDGISVKTMHGGIFTYASIQKMPPKAIEKAKSNDMSPSLFWAIKLLDKTGVAVTPGSSFGEKPGTYHFRLTIVPKIEDIETALDAIERFHKRFMDTYR